MAWKRDRNGFFTKAQHKAMVKLFTEQKKTLSQIAEIAGCAPGSVRGVLVTAGVYQKEKKKERKTPEVINKIVRTMPWTEGGPATDPLERSIDKNINLEEENSYLRWLVAGILNHVKDKTYIDRLVDDLQNGRFNP